MGGLAAHSVIKAVGTKESFLQAIHSTRGDGHIGFVGVAHEGGDLPMVARCSSPRSTSTADPHRFAGTCPKSSSANGTTRSTPGIVFDLELTIEEAAEGYKAMDERRATKVLLKL